MVWKARGIGAGILAGTALLAGACGSSSSSSGSATKSPITIGFVGDETGPFSSVFGDGNLGAAAAIDAQNAAGGINGHPIKLVEEDSTSSPLGVSTAVQLLINQDHVLGIIEDDGLFFAGAKFAQQAGIPVTGEGLDGPEWFQQPNTNMFNAYENPIGSIGGSVWGYPFFAAFMKQMGVTKLAVLANASPSAVSNAKMLAYFAQQNGISVCYENTSVPVGGVDFTADVLQIKQAGCDGVQSLVPDAPSIALAQAIKNAGIQSQFKVIIPGTGYDNNVLSQPSARAAIQGDYFGTNVNFTTPNAATQKMLTTLEKYDTQFHGGIPDLGAQAGYAGAELMIYGLQHAGSTPTSASFISNLRKVNTYNEEGVYTNSVANFTNFGTAQMLPAQLCDYFVQLQSTGFSVVNGGKTICAPATKTPLSS